jgi:peptidoglycan biosynthesis protein MviN/MurJ (putative lipid II flippase)
MKHRGRRTGAAKAAEVASGLGAMVLGAGMALLLPDGLRRHAIALLVGGAVVHGLGMSLRYRLERREGKPLWWERLVFWLCWALLIALGAWIAADALARTG